MAEEKQASILQLFRYADGVDKCLLLLGVIGSIGDGLTTPLSMFILGSTINSYGSLTTSFSNDLVKKETLKLFYVAIGVATGAFIAGVCWTRTAGRQASLMRRRYLEAVLRQDVSYFDANSGTTATFQVVSSISSDVDVIQDCLSDKIPNIIAHLSSLAISFIAAFTLSWRLTLAALPISLLYIVPGVVYGKLMMDTGAEMRTAYEVAGGIAEQAISSVRTVFSYVAERETIERFKQALEKSMALGIKEGLMKGCAIGSMGMIFASWAFLGWVASVLVIETGASGGSVFMAAICAILGGLSIMSVLPDVKYLSLAVDASSRIYEMVDRLPPLESIDGRGESIDNLRGEIKFKNVVFTYPSRPDSPVLRGLNLRVAAGQTIGLVGGSGSGKSTTISLLQRFYSPDKGKISFDGHDIKTLNLKWLRAQMGLVGQEPVLFATTIKENILFGNEKASMDQIISAAKAANAHDFINKLPNGYDTHVGHFGHQMSGGQKQRIAIARALIRDPKILLLDEATSALDAQSEKLVQDALDHASIGRTTIIVAHRLATLRRADSIVVLQLGEVVESGTHDELMEMNGRDGIYSKMVQLQKSAVGEVAVIEKYARQKRTSTRSPVTSAVHSPRISSSLYGTPVSPLMSSIHSSQVSQVSPSIPSSPVHSVIMDQYRSDDSKKVNKKRSRPSQWELIKMNKPEWKNVLLGCIGAVSFGAAQAVHSYYLGTVLSVFFLPDNDLIRSKTRFYCFIFLIVGTISVVANIILHYNFAIMGERLTKRVREKMLEKVLSFEIGWFDKDENSSAAICARLATEASLVKSLVGDRLSLVLQAAMSALLAFILGLVIAWRLSSVMIAVQPLVIGSLYLRRVLMTSMSKKAKKAQTEGSQLASEAVVNHRTITAFSSQKRILGLFEASQEGPRRENIRQSWFSGFGLFLCQFVVTSSIALTFWYGGKLMIGDKVTSKELFQAFFLLISTGKLIADAGSMTSDLAKGGEAVSSVLEILDRKTLIEPDDREGVKKQKSIKGQIALKGVVFSYPSRPEQIIFNGLNLKIDAGKTMALVGQSGSGKSTVIGLIERFYDPLKGTVEIDGLNVKSYNLRFLRSHIALVSQEPTLFAGSIRDNIVYGKENATENEIVKAASLANAHEFICSMEDGYDTYCGERGVQLSGGQKQRIALARAVLKKPTILLLDEATSALDSVSENLVQEALDKMMKGRTCVVVAHRLSTIQKSDSIALIKNGKVVEQGTHSELLAIGRGGAYYKLMKLQQGNSPYTQPTF